MNQATPAGFTLQQVTFAIDQRPLLRHLTLAFAPQQITGLIGHNGSGKSTLLKILARLQSPQQGQAHWRGQALSAWQDREFARQVAYLPQAVPPADGMTVRDLVSLGRYAWHGALGRFREQDRDAVSQAIASVDLRRAENHLVDTLSGGERQRAWLAMCVVQGSQCLLLDEPISALDVAHQKDVLELIRHLSRQRQLSVIMVLHDINMAARFCDRLVALRQGQVIFHGTPDELMTPDRLQDIYNVPMGVMRDSGGQHWISYVQ